MKLTKSKLKQIIQEEYQRVLSEVRPRVPDTDNFTFAEYEDGSVFAIMNCDELDYQGNCPSVEVELVKMVRVNGEAYMAASAELDAALMAATESQR